MEIFSIVLFILGIAMLVASIAVYFLKTTNSELDWNNTAMFYRLTTALLVASIASQLFVLAPK